MSVIRRFSPFDEIKRLENEVSDIFRTFHSQHGVRESLPVNIWEDGDNYRVEAFLPGFDIDNIDIEASAQYIEIEGERFIDEEETEDNLLVREVNSGKFRRRINFDKPVNTSEANTTFKNGVLTIMLPKMEEGKTISLTPKMIEA